MKTNALRVSALLSLAVLASISAGCVAARNAAEDTVSTIRGATEVVLDKPIERVGRAAETAVRDMKFSAIDSRIDAVSGIVTAKTAQDTKIEIRVNKVSDNTTHVMILVGTFGDEALSREILSQIKKRL